VPDIVPIIAVPFSPLPPSKYPTTNLLAVFLSKDKERKPEFPVLKTTSLPKLIDVPDTVPTTAVP